MDPFGSTGGPHVIQTCEYWWSNSLQVFGRSLRPRTLADLITSHPPLKLVGLTYERLRPDLLKIMCVYFSYIHITLYIYTWHQITICLVYTTRALGYHQTLVELLPIQGLACLCIATAHHEVYTIVRLRIRSIQRAFTWRHMTIYIYRYCKSQYSI